MSQSDRFTSGAPVEIRLLRRKEWISATYHHWSSREWRHEVDVDGERIRVADGRVRNPKAPGTRTVTLSAEDVRVLRRMRDEIRENALDYQALDPNAAYPLLERLIGDGQ
jgi:hypothetical protein